MGMVDGPTEVHKITVARQLLREYRPYDTIFPPYHLPTARERALERDGLRATLPKEKAAG
jgi:acyl-CoA dehydrogenase